MSEFMKALLMGVPLLVGAFIALYFIDDGNRRAE